MSFSEKTKTELCRAPLGRSCCQLAEIYGILLYAAVFTHREIRITTESQMFARRASLLLDKVFGVKVTPTVNGRRRVLHIADERSLRAIMTKLGYDFKSYITYHLNRNMVEDECCAASFLRGIFLMSGSVAGPDKKSHLEIKCSHQTLCREVVSLMLDHGVTPKMTARRTSYLIYLKDTAGIEDLLTRIGASRAAMAIMEAKVEKNLRNNINRQVNCETANLVKTTDVSARQIAAIERALAVGGIEIYPENLRETVDLRVANPAASLSELAALFDPPISKPGLSHRLRRIMQISQTLLEREGG